VSARLPLVGVSTSLSSGDGPERAYVNAAYLRAVQAAGGTPLLLAPPVDGAARTALFEAMDALLLTGGGDVDPARFGEAPHPSVSDVVPSRDALELEALRVALDRALPVLAICRGIQVLNVGLGGTLVQDLASEPGGPIQHGQHRAGIPRDKPTHPVSLAPDSRLARVMGTVETEVNSMHHQAVKALGTGLRAVAWAPDGVVEGVELPAPDRFVVGVQWHPEELTAQAESARRLFAALVEAARARR
jgi:putative glutamine amidotransferase